VGESEFDLTPKPNLCSTHVVVDVAVSLREDGSRVRIMTEA